jgi:hypothetical protein
MNPEFLRSKELRAILDKISWQGKKLAAHTSVTLPIAANLKSAELCLKKLMVLKEEFNVMCEADLANVTTFRTDI